MTVDKEKLNILFVGDQNPNFRTQQRVKTFRDLGYDVSIIDLNKKLSNGLELLIYKVSIKLGYPLDLADLNKKLKHYNTIVDILWLEKPLSLQPRTLKRFKEKHPDAQIVFYSEDNMFKKHNNSKYFLSYMKNLDLFLTTKKLNFDSPLANKIKAMMYLKKAFCKRVHFKESIDKKYDVTFVGTYEKDRAETMLHIAKNGIKINIFGSGWNNFEKHENLIIHDGVYDKDYRSVINKSKIALCFLRKINDDQHTSRSIEIPAMGTFMLAERTQEHLEIFEEGKNAEFFENKSELLSKIQKYLSDNNQREEVALNGYNYVTKAGFEHEDRIKEVLRRLNYE